jgi:transmembrane sensor
MSTLSQNHEPVGGPRAACEREASEWLARRDRGLTPAQQDAFLKWLRDDPRNGAAIARLERTWAFMDRLSRWRPEHSSRPNPDLLARPMGRRLWFTAGSLAAAAALVLGAILWHTHSSLAAQRHRTILHPGPERLVLDDGSIVELNAGAKVDVKFSPAERRVRLVRGEAHFSVAKDPSRPFVVGADQFAVCAVGTAFNVSMDRESVSVLVTEGRVRIDDASPQDGGPPAQPRVLSQLVEGQRAVIQIAAARPSVSSAPAAAAPAAPPARVTVSEVTPAEIAKALSWEGMRIEFIDMPLGDVAAEFNRYNRRKLVVADSATAAILVGGDFRVDNVDAFVRLLGSSFGVSATPDGDRTILRLAR